MPEDPKRLNIRTTEEVHYWLNLEAARHGRSLQQHVNQILSDRADTVKAEYGGVRPGK